MQNKKVLLICVQSHSILSFRRGLILALKESGYDVSAIAFDNNNTEEITKLGVKLFVIDDNNRSLNPIKLLTLKKKIKKIIEEEEPGLVFTFMLKPNIFGVLAAKSYKKSAIFSMVEGVGDVYTRTGIKWAIIRLLVTILYKQSFKRADKVFFLNNDNKNEFIRRGIIEDSNKIEVIPGIGVDLNRFQYTPMTNHQTVLMVARLLKTKGVFEYCEAAKLLKEKYPNAIFQLLGPEGEIKKADLQPYIDAGYIEYIPQKNDVRPYLKDCGIFVLPSYKEGLSMSIMEAESTGRAIITSNTTGCVDSIEVNKNGLLAAVGNVNDLAEKISQLLGNEKMTQEFGKASRKIAEDKFDQTIINKKVIALIGENIRG